MKKWKVLHEQTTNKQLTTEELIDVLLKNRGITTKKEKEDFLQPDLSSVTINSVEIDKKQVTRAIRRIKKAIDEKEQIVVYGDYDVDGITASAIIWETIHDLGGNIMPYIPSRMDEGYGLSLKGISNVKSQIPNVKLIITVDNGIVAHEAVEFANSQGIDVIITDHHVESSSEKGLPKAHTIVHTTKLCGAGIAWLFAKEIKDVISTLSSSTSLTVEGEKSSDSNQQISRSARDDSWENDQHLELAALGTVADLVPLTGANRAIVKFGIKKLCSTKRPGLLALFEEAACDQSTVGVYHIGHIIAPRLNASGRIEHAMDSLRLLCTKDKRRAMELAIKLGVTNRERQTIMRNATEHAVTQVKNQKSKIKNILVIDHEEYQEGVIGLVAGKLVEEFYRPSIVISRKEKLSKGSVRSVNGFNIIEFLRTHGGEHFVNVGGHPMAAGFTIETDKIVMLKNILELKADELLTDDILQRTVTIDSALPFSSVTKELFHSLRKLEPFGMSNYEPVFMTEGVTIRDIRKIGKEGQHLKLYVESENISFEAVAFGIGERATEFQEGDKVSIAYTIDQNTWNGNTKLQLRVKDIKN